MARCRSRGLHVYSLRLDILQATSAKGLGEDHGGRLLGGCEKGRPERRRRNGAGRSNLADRRLFLANGFERVRRRTTNCLFGSSIVTPLTRFSRKVGIKNSSSTAEA